MEPDGNLDLAMDSSHMAAVDTPPIIATLAALVTVGGSAHCIQPDEERPRPLYRTEVRRKWMKVPRKQVSSQTPASLVDTGMQFKSDWTVIFRICSVYGRPRTLPNSRQRSMEPDSLDCAQDWIVPRSFASDTWRGNGMSPSSRLEGRPATTRQVMTKCVRHRLGRQKWATPLVSWSPCAQQAGKLLSLVFTFK